MTIAREGGGGVRLCSSRAASQRVRRGDTLFTGRGGRDKGAEVPWPLLEGRWRLCSSRAVSQRVRLGSTPVAGHSGKDEGAEVLWPSREGRWRLCSLKAVLQRGRGGKVWQGEGVVVDGEAAQVLQATLGEALLQRAGGRSSAAAVHHAHVWPCKPVG